MGHPRALTFHQPPDRDGGTGIIWEIPWQTGPVKEVGVNGVQADAVLEQVSAYLRSFLPPMENGEPLTYGQECTESAVIAIEMALHHLGQRTKDREERGVEGTSAP